MSSRRLLRITAGTLCAAALFAAAQASAGNETADDAASPAAEAAPAPDAAPPKATRPRVSSQLSRAVNVREAERVLVQAQKKRRLGAAPLPGESIRVAGGIAVNTRYWNRQESLRLEVEQAQRRLNKLLGPQLAQRHAAPSGTVADMRQGTAPACPTSNCVRLVQTGGLQSQ